METGSSSSCSQRYKQKHTRKVQTYSYMYITCGDQDNRRHANEIIIDHFSNHALISPHQWTSWPTAHLHYPSGWLVICNQCKAWTLYNILWCVESIPERVPYQSLLKQLQDEESWVISLEMAIQLLIQQISACCSPRWEFRCDSCGVRSPARQHTGITAFVKYVN